MFLTEAAATLAQAARAERVGRRAGRRQAGLIEIGYVGSGPFSPVFSRIIRSFRESFGAIHLRVRRH